MSDGLKQWKWVAVAAVVVLTAASDGFKILRVGSNGIVNETNITLLGSMSSAVAVARLYDVDTITGSVIVGGVTNTEPGGDNYDSGTITVYPIYSNSVTILGNAMTTSFAAAVSGPGVGWVAQTGADAYYVFASLHIDVPEEDLSLRWIIPAATLSLTLDKTTTNLGAAPSLPTSYITTSEVITVSQP